MTDTFSGLADDVDAGTYPGAEDNLGMELATLEHIADTSAEVGIDSRLPVLMRDLARRAVDTDHGTDGYSRLVDILRAD